MTDRTQTLDEKIVETTGNIRKVANWLVPALKKYPAFEQAEELMKDHYLQAKGYDSSNPNHVKIVAGALQETYDNHPWLTGLAKFADTIDKVPSIATGVIEMTATIAGCLAGGPLGAAAAYVASYTENLPAEAIEGILKLPSTAVIARYDRIGAIKCLASDFGSLIAPGPGEILDLMDTQINAAYSIVREETKLNLPKLVGGSVTETPSPEQSKPGQMVEIHLGYRPRK